MSTQPDPEVMSHAAALRYTAAMSAAATATRTSLEQTVATMRQRHIGPAALGHLDRARDEAGLLAEQLHAAEAVLRSHDAVRDAYAAAPDAGDKTWMTDDAPQPSTSPITTVEPTMPAHANEPVDPGGLTDLADPAEVPDVLGLAGTPGNVDVIGSDQVRGQTAVPANVLLSDWDSQDWEPGGTYVVLETPGEGETQPSAAPMSPAEAEQFAGQLENLADRAERGERPAKTSKYGQAAQRIADDIEAGQADPAAKVWWGDDGELPLTNRELLELLRQADPAGTADDGTRTHTVCQTAADAGGDAYANWARITPDGSIAVTAIEGVGGSSNPEEEFWQDRTSLHTPASARDLAGKVRTFAQAAHAVAASHRQEAATASEPEPTPVPDPGPAAAADPVTPRLVRNARGEDTEYDPATGISTVIQRDGWRAPVPASSPTGVSIRLLHMREAIKDGRGNDVTDSTARVLLGRMTVSELREVAAEIGVPTSGARTKAQLTDNIVKTCVSSVRKHQDPIPKVAGHTLTSKQLAALHGLYKGLVEQQKGAPVIYGVNVRRQLEALADAAIISRTGTGAYMIPFGSPGEQIVNATPDFSVGSHL